MRQNYQKQLDDFLQDLPRDPLPKLLLHSCCGPCSTYVLSYLSKYFDITIYFYNPNIMPKTEYDQRLSAQKEVIEGISFPNPIHLIVPTYDTTEFIKIAKGFENEPERGKRCQKCIDLRLDKSAAYAAENGYDYFCTTLSVSPHKDAVLINDLSEQYAQKYGTPSIPTDFKKKNGFLESIQLSKKLGIYRQNYCGCIFSKNNEE